MTGIIDETIEASEEGWVEITRVEALLKIEQFLTQDAVAFEIEYMADPTPVGEVQTFTWFLLDEFGDQSPRLLALKDPANAKAAVRWFLHQSFVTD